jgi:Na+-driven multidrug efflux pump
VLGHIALACAGAGEPQAAKRAVTTGLLISWSLQAVYLALLVSLRWQLAHAFLPYSAMGSREVTVLMECMLLIAAGSIGDWTNCTLGGALQGAGRQVLGAKIYACTHWGLGVVLLWLFAFHLGWEVRGIWLALSCISNVQCIFMVVRPCLLCAVTTGPELRCAARLVLAGATLPIFCTTRSQLFARSRTVMQMST